MMSVSGIQFINNSLVPMNYGSKILFYPFPLLWTHSEKGKGEVYIVWRACSSSQALIHRSPTVLAIGNELILFCVGHHLKILLAVTVFKTFLYLINLTVLNDTGQLFCKIVFHWKFVWYSTLVTQSLWIFERRPQR